MRPSHRTIYGLRAIMDLAYHGDGEPTQGRDIAERSCIPIRFLEKILQALKKEAVVTSKRGPNGGYVLAADPEELTLARLFEVLDDLPTLPDVACDDEVDGTAAVADEVCREVVERMVLMLQDVTVADLIRRGERQGLTRQSYEGFVYVI